MRQLTFRAPSADAASRGSTWKAVSKAMPSKVWGCANRHPERGLFQPLWTPATALVRESPGVVLEGRVDNRPRSFYGVLTYEMRSIAMASRRRL